jgi:peptidoglycan/xylan/chitin deacetylase (PgdA/CDA1 family)
VDRKRSFRRVRRLLLAITFALALAAPASAFGAPTVVSLTFDDGLSDQIPLQTMLAQHSMHATFYINSDNIGAAGYMTWTDLSNIAAAGNEIAGHTLDHVDLTSVSTGEATRQVCDDHQALVSHGLTVTDFAYPFGAENPSLYPILQGCGYNTGRRAWGLCAIGTAPNACTDPVTETIPPRNIWATGTLPSIKSFNTLADLESAVTRAQANGGGWVTFVFHHLCDGCDPGGYSISPSVLAPFLDWLGQQAANDTVVRMVRDVVSDTTAPVTSIACNGAACSTGWYKAPVTVTLSASDAGTEVSAIRYTTDGTDPTTSSPTYTGPFSVSATTTVKYRAWDVAGNVSSTKSQTIQIDTVPPTVSITSPANGATVGGNVKIVTSPADTPSGVASVKVFVDGTLLGTATSSPWQVAWNTKRVKRGQHVLTAIATDRGGNSTTSAAVTVTVG